MLKSYLLFLPLFISVYPAFSQQQPIKRKQFFSDDSVINVQLTTDMRKLKNDKSKPVWLPAHIIMNFPDTSSIDENIQIEPRGTFRKENCDLASLMLDFNTTSSPLLSNLKKLKLVGGCKSNEASNELVLKEYLVYRMYNFLSGMSFRVRLLHITYNDTKQNIKPYTQYAFLIEDIKDVAARNDCKEIKNKPFNSESTDRNQITFVSIFEYMIGNTDWSLPNYHNVKLLVPLTDTIARPYTVPYDFDFCGVVDAPYATPDENLDIKSVRDRYYKGYARTMQELDPITVVFKDKHDAIMQYVNNFYLLDPKGRKDISNYLAQFYDILAKESSIHYAFITNALNQ